MRVWLCVRVLLCASVAGCESCCVRVWLGAAGKSDVPKLIKCLAPCHGQKSAKKVYDVYKCFAQQLQIYEYSPVLLVDFELS